MSTETSAPSGTVRRLLIVDDETVLLVPLTRYFRDLGFEVDTARTEHEAMAQLERHSVDCIILDLALSRFGHEGLDLFAAIRAQRPRLPIIILSAFISADVEHELLRLGARAVLKKPHTLLSLAERVSDAMGATT